MKCVLEAHHCLPAGEEPSRLDGILHPFGAAVDEKRALLMIPRRDRIQPLGQLDVRLVGRDREREMEIVIELVPNRGEHLGMPVPYIQSADSAGEIDQAVAIGVGNHRAFRMRHRDGRDRGDRR